MTLPRSISDVLTNHVWFEIESIDRMCRSSAGVLAAVRGSGTAHTERSHRGMTERSTSAVWEQEAAAG